MLRTHSPWPRRPRLLHTDRSRSLLAKSRMVVCRRQGEPVTRVAYYRHLARCLAAMAARMRWMKQDVVHELWASRAQTALMCMRMEIAEEASTPPAP